MRCHALLHNPRGRALQGSDFGESSIKVVSRRDRDTHPVLILLGQPSDELIALLVADCRGRGAVRGGQGRIWEKIEYAHVCMCRGTVPIALEGVEQSRVRCRRDGMWRGRDQWAKQRRGGG